MKMERKIGEFQFNTIFKILFIVFCLFVCGVSFFTFSNNSYAADEDIAVAAVTGSGTSADPYIIGSADDLNYMATQCNNSAGNYQTAYYKQICNISISSWNMINSFSGTYDGQGYLITDFTNSSKIDFAFFNRLESSAVIKNLGFTNVNFSVSTEDKCDVATLAVTNYGTISNCFAQGNFNLKVRKDGNHLYSAGLVDYMNGGLIENCYSDVDIDVDSPGAWVSYMNVAGIACQLSGGTIRNCYSIATLKIDYCLYYKIGGIVAKDEDGGRIENCAILQNSCSVDGKTKNNIATYNVGSPSFDISNTSVISAENLKNMGAAPLSSWEWNATNNFPRTWGFVSDTSSGFYNGGYPQLRVFYESFNLNVYNENGTSLITTQTTRYPDYAFYLSNISVQTKKGHTFNGEFSTQVNSEGTKYSGIINGVVSDYTLYAAYDINYYRLYVKNTNPLACGTVDRDERIAYDSVVTVDLNGVTPGYRFVAWRDINTNAFVSDHEVAVFNMPDYDIEVYPEFVEHTFFVRTNINDNSLGTVTGTNDYYLAGETVTLTAQPIEGYKVDKFYLEDGTVLSTNSTYSFTMTNTNKVINVDFVPIEYTLTVQAYPAGAAVVSGSGQYNKDDQVTLSYSNIQSGYTFAGWKIGNISNVSAYADASVNHTMPASNQIIYCYFITSNDKYISFIDTNDKVISEHIIATGGSITPPTVPIKNGYRFVGWYTQKENGTQITNFSNISSSFNVYTRYEKVFNCAIELSLREKDGDLKVKDNTLIFVALKNINETYTLALGQQSSEIFNLINYGTYTIDYVLPTHFDVEIYKDGVKIGNTFNVSLNDEEIRIQFILTNTLDKWLYDGSNYYDDITINDSIIVDPIIEVGGETKYVGIDSAISDFEFNDLEYSQQPISPYGYDLKDVIGATNWGGLYNFTEMDYLNEGANFVANDLGSSVYKVSLANHYKEMYPFNANWGTNSINSMVDLAKSPAYSELFSNSKIKTYVLIAYEFVYCPWERVVTENYELADLEMYYEYVRTEFANLTRHLLTTYMGTDKVFVLSNWEGDNAYGAIYDMCTTDEQRQKLTDAYVGYINARQDGIIRGRKEVSSNTTTKVYGNFEINHIGQNIPYVPNRWRLVDVAVPYTYCDLYSISDWYTYLQHENSNYMFPLESLLDQLYSAVQSNLSYTNPSTYPKLSDFNGKKNIMITEFGYDENTDSQFNERLQHEVETAIEWGVYKLIYWCAYSNVRLDAGTERPKNEEVQGLWLVKPDGTFSDAFWYFKSLINKKDYITQSPKLIFEANESGFDWATYSNKIIFKDDLTNLSKAKDYSENLISLYSFDVNSENYKYFEEFNSHYGSVDTTGIIQTDITDELSYITYEMKSNRFGILLYNYNSYFGYQDLSGNKLNELIVIEGKTQTNNWEKIDNLTIDQTQSSRADGHLYWFQTCITGTAPIEKYSELRISFINKGYNAWDPIITSVVFFEGGQA